MAPDGLNNIQINLIHDAIEAAYLAGYNARENGFDANVPYSTFPIATTLIVAIDEAEDRI